MVCFSKIAIYMPPEMDFRLEKIINGMLGSTHIVRADEKAKNL